MNAVSGFISEHPAVLIMVIAFILIILLYFVFKKLIQVILVILLVVFAVGGFFFIKDPENIRKTVDTLSAGMSDISEKSKNMYTDLKDIFKKGKKVPGEINRMLDDSKEQAGK
ncbi:MAG TPA: hypothetical protein ENN23_03845 [Deltaproteobacteria bacterium]|nr:hypothetical protein [Deltaproteobacteria bacterium]